MNWARCLRIIHLLAFFVCWGAFVVVPEAQADWRELLGKESPGLCGEGLGISADVLRARLFAVHATNFFPENGVISAGNNPDPSFRPGIHFSLGEVVRPHEHARDTYSWDNMTYALVMPVGAIEEQLVNIETYDSFSLGDVRLSPEAIYVVPEAQVDRVPRGAHYVTYGGSLTMRQAVNQAIKISKAWKLTMKNRVGLGWPAERNGQNINHRAFFAPLLKENPQMGYGSHLNSEVGEGFRFGYIDQALQTMIPAFGSHGMNMTHAEIQFLTTVIRHNLDKLDAFVRRNGFAAEVVANYLAKRQEALSWLSFVEIDNEIRSEYGFTLLKMDSDLLVPLFALKRDRQKLKEAVLALLQARKLPPAGRDDFAPSPQSLASEMAGMPFLETKSLLDQAPGFLQDQDVSVFWLVYAIERAINTNGAAEATDHLSLLIDLSAKSASRHPKARMVARFDLLGFFTRAFAPLNDRQPIAKAILSRPSVREYFQRAMGVSFPQEITLKDLKAAYERQ